MRTLAPWFAGLAALLAAAAPARAADDAIRVEIEVGKTTPPIGILPRCDDLSVAAPTDDSRGLKGLKVGTTVCSFDRSGGAGIRLVFRVVVVPPKPKPAPSPGGADAPSSPERAR